MFGFFKKKGGEIPEEQQRQQRGAQEGQTRQDAAEVPQEFRALGQDFLPEELKRVLNNPDSQGIMHYKYIPRTGGGFTQADAEYVCLNPKAAKLPDDVKKYPADQLTYMGGQVRWHIPTWEDMPTQYHVAQALGSLPVKRIVGAVRSEGYTLGDLYGQTTVM